VPKLKNWASSATSSAVRRPRHLDHRADQVLDPGLLLFEDHVDLIDDLILDVLELGDGADERNHDLGQHDLALLLDVEGRFDDGPALHAGDGRIGYGQPAATMTEHRVELVQLVHLGFHYRRLDAQTLGHLGLRFAVAYSFSMAFFSLASSVAATAWSMAA